MVQTGSPELQEGLGFGVWWNRIQGLRSGTPPCTLRYLRVYVILFVGSWALWTVLGARSR